MTWWWWTVLGLVLLGGEVVTPGGFFALFFGLSAIMVGTLEGLGVVLQPWSQWALFSGLAVLMVALFRRPLQRMAEPVLGAPDVDKMIGEIATLVEDVAPGGIAKAELRGTSWSVKNDDSRALSCGERTRVVRVEGLTLWVRAESPAGGEA